MKIRPTRLRTAIGRVAKRLADYHYHRQRGHGIRAAWQLAANTL